MKLLGRILILFLILLYATASKAQTPLPQTNTSNLRIKKLAVYSDTLFLDTLNLVPGSIIIRNVDSAAYLVDHVRGTLYWKQRPVLDSVDITYRVFPVKLNSVVQRYRYDSVVHNVYLRPFEFNRNADEGRGGLLDFGSIQANGSLGRELSFGNNQDAVVNSNFQLQINGMLRDSIELSAAFSDNNIPIQPDGTTTQLNEFDRIFLQFKKRNWQLNLGDIDIRQNNMYFLNFYKRLQGLAFQTSSKISPSVTSSTLVIGSIDK